MFLKHTFFIIFQNLVPGKYPAVHGNIHPGIQQLDRSEGSSQIKRSITAADRMKLPEAEPRGIFRPA